MSAVIPAALALGGALALLSGALLLRGVHGYRVARMLRAAREVPVAEAARRASEADASYVRVRGRIVSAEEFPDEQDRPLVFRARRLEVSEGDGTWRTLEDERMGVPFGLQDRGSEIGVDVDALHEGLVVIPRESTGLAAQVAGRVPPEIPGEALVRYRVDQVSAVEHAVAAGVPSLTPDRRPILTAGLGRPLILTTLEIPEAMRVLAGEQRRTVIIAAGLLATGVALVALALATWLGGHLLLP